MKRTRLLLLACILVAPFLLQCGQLAEQSAEPTVHITYLPIVYSGPRPALKGIGLTGSCSAVEKLGVNWYYAWHWRPPCSSAGFVPMLRDIGCMAELDQAVGFARASGWLMGFNEPDKPEPYGHLTTPEEGAVAWRAIERQAVGIRLVSPVPSQDDFNWLWRMVAAYESFYGEKPRFDAIGVHWYNWQNPSSVQPAKDYLLRVRREALAHGYDVPLWLTEFAGHVGRPDPAGGHQKLMEEFIPWMREQSWIGRYAWFASRVRPMEPWCAYCQYCSLTYEDGTLTPIGITYRGIE